MPELEDDMSLREKIEAAKAEGTRIREDLDYAGRVTKTAEEKAARELAMSRAQEIMVGLPGRVAEEAEASSAPVRLVVCSLESIASIEELRRSFRHPGCYVLRALEEEGYSPTVSLDCSGNWSTNNSLLCSF